MTASIITKARTTELTESGINARMNEIARLSGHLPRLEILLGGEAKIRFNSHTPLTPVYEGQSVEDVLVMARDDLMRSIADEQMDGLGCEAAE